jgi:hypothetical protein
VKAKNKYEYAKAWKQQVLSVLDGPVLDLPLDHSTLRHAIQEDVLTLCRDIDAAAYVIAEAGTFDE